ncbi:MULTISPECIES: ParB/RepB/Spo0J family partition protein [Gammaproteobacteria]|uniref:ParB/RepB/Spo0J family partition protein n=1 Tax=Gammaproteobacteria TaxID=1236 RepID=UPI001E3AA57E|nr:MULTISPECIES: ParB/RepB/Spo0J family partition protein [Gammaproteobacteria]MDP4945665.1 ParB/RepB/Spo0J family partition protein [Alishewanella sp.]MDP5206752.1 ParB/RepB/Spo0J family partition protein [Alishewanella sp. SMS9]MCC5452318.1 ParB/RepB/Spo0J family partition protein [Rheinheimera sp. UJ51]MCF4008908.1 ParB/RepB/Spo0J family partition protein [Rheinheimera sp. UJ63]MDP5186150.1 ParB/RepB/Spo0J family partition protein [Alishewanella sp.]
MSLKKRGLGRGLDALLTASKPTNTVDVAPIKSELQTIPVEFLRPGKYQPRKDMSQEALDDLASSIKAQGVIQPIVVRTLAENSYEIIAGERRWRAAQLAQLAEVPCLIKNVPDEAAVAIALIENIQREDLNAMEEAIALQRLLSEFELTHQQVADAVGKSRTTVTNLLRLNQLNDDVKLLLEHGDIEMGHARALLALSDADQSDAARLVAAKQMTVRDTENLVRKILEPAPVPEPKVKDPDVIALEQRLSDRFAAPVQIQYNKKGKGSLMIAYNSLDELDGILGKLGQEQSE